MIFHQYETRILVAEPWRWGGGGGGFDRAMIICRLPVLILRFEKWQPVYNTIRKDRTVSLNNHIINSCSLSVYSLYNVGEKRAAGLHSWDGFLTNTSKYTFGKWIQTMLTFNTLLYMYTLQGTGSAKCTSMQLY